MKVIVVRKQSTWDQYHQNPLAFGRLRKDSLRRAKASHFRQERSTNIIFEAFHQLGIKPWVIDGAEAAFNSSGAALVVTIGGDGTLLSASHHVSRKVPLLGVNSDPIFSLGHFCAAVSGSALKTIGMALTNPRTQLVTRMEVKVNGKLVAKRILNEALFSHSCPAAMTRLSVGIRRGKIIEDEDFACSGIWVGTGAGSTGAIASAGGKVLPPTALKLEAVVREPCRAGNQPIVAIQPGFDLRSRTADATLYLDGPFLRVPVGFDQKVSFRISKDPLQLIVPR